MESVYGNFDAIANNAGIRHTQGQKTSLEANFSKMTLDEKETWYDRAFQTTLICLAGIPYLQFLPELKQMKQ